MSKSQRTLRVISVVNQKGGVGKTTTTINLGAALAERGFKVLLIDLDPQGNASTGLGLGASDRQATTYDVIFDGAPPETAVQKTDFQNLSILPATTDLSSADIALSDHDRRSFLLKDALTRSLHFHGYDYILIDCPPALNILTINAMVASDSVLVPLQSEFFALEGLSQLILTIREVRETANKDLRIEGIVMTMYDRRNNLSMQVEEDARQNLGNMVYRTVIPRNVRLSEAPSFALPVLVYDPSSKGSIAYRALAQELIDRAT